MERTPRTVESNKVVDLEAWKGQKAKASQMVEAIVEQHRGDLEALSRTLSSKLQEIAETNDNQNRFLAEALAGELWLVENQIKLSQINGVAEAA